MARIPTAETNPDGGGSFLGVGRHHCIVDSCELITNDKGTQIVAELQCLASDSPEAASKTHREYFGLTGKAAGRLLTFYCAIDLYSREQWQADKAAGVSPDIDESKAVGRQLMVELQDEEYEGKKKAKAGFRFHHVNAKEVASWPKDQASLLMLGGASNGDRQPVAASASGDQWSAF